jgi:hypothetical protein
MNTLGPGRVLSIEGYVPSRCSHVDFTGNLKLNRRALLLLAPAATRLEPQRGLQTRSTLVPVRWRWFNLVQPLKLAVPVASPNLAATGATVLVATPWVW